jgi:hypothetical protein
MGRKKTKPKQKIKKQKYNNPNSLINKNTISKNFNLNKKPPRKNNLIKNIKTQKQI